MLRLGLLSLVLAIFVSTIIHFPTLLEAAAGGLIAGALIAALGLRLTQFSSDEKGRYYTPNSYIGAAVTLLLVGRITYWMIMIFMMPGAAATAAQAPAGGNPFASLGQSPLTLAMLMLTLGYYLTYFAGVLIKSRALARPVADNSPPANPS
jgi:hypothetical protein